MAAGEGLTTASGPPAGRHALVTGGGRRIGRTCPDPSDELPLSAWDLVLDTTLRGTFLARRAFGWLLLDGGWVAW